MQIPDNIMDEILELLQGGQKIAAIKVYKDHTQASLVDAKIAIEALQSELANSKPSELDSSTKIEIEELLSRGQKLDAIKIYRSQHNCSLMEAKLAVERIAKNEQIKQTESTSSSKPGGCLSVIVFVAFITATALMGIVH